MISVKNALFLIALFTCFFGINSNSFAQNYSKDLSINQNSIRLSTDRVLEGNAVRIYTIVINNSNYDLRGLVQFYDQTAGRQIGSDQTVSILANGSDGVFVDWIPYFEGTHHIQISIDPWENSGDNPDNNFASISANVLKDTDWDGITDEDDPDDDNDGVLDEDDIDSKNKGPTIIIAGNTAFAFLNREIHLSAADSFDEDGEISTYQWYVNGSEPIKNKELNIIVKENSPQSIKLVLTDNKNETRERYVEISVIDLDFYLISFLLLIIIFLAIIINIKYSSWAKKLLKKLKK